MTWINRLKSIFRSNRFELRPGHRIEPAFTVGGIEYFQFPDILSMGFERALSALAFYEELRMRTTREYLDAHCMAVENILSDPKKINVAQLAILNKNLQDRLKMVVEPQIVYKLASVLYFDNTENPYRYDYQYGVTKIERWKKEKSLKDFFLSTPIKDLIPGLSTYEENLESYSRVVEMLNDKTLTSILSTLSDTQQQYESVRKLRSQNGSLSKLN